MCVCVYERKKSVYICAWSKRGKEKVTPERNRSPFLFVPESGGTSVLAHKLNLAEREAFGVK